MTALVLWLLLFVLSWPLAILALVLYPVVWLLSMPLRLLGVSVRGAIDLVGAVIQLPARLIGGVRV